MKRTVDSTMIALGAAVVFALLSGQDAPGPETQIPPASPGATSTTPTAAEAGRPRGKTRDRGWQNQLGRPRQVSAVLTPDMIDLCMEVARDIDVEMATKLEALRKRDIKHFAAKLRNSRRLMTLAELRKKDPNSYQLKIAELKVDAAVVRLAAEARKARKAGRVSEADALEKDLKIQTILQLAFRHRAREDYLCRLQEIVERLEKELKDEKDNFDDVLEERIKELLREPESPHGDTGLPAPMPELDQASRLILPDVPE